MARVFFKNHVNGYFVDEVKYSGYLFPDVNIDFVRSQAMGYLKKNLNVDSVIIWKKEGSMIYQEGIVKRKGKGFTWTSTHNPKEIDRTINNHGDLRKVTKKTTSRMHPFGL